MSPAKPDSSVGALPELRPASGALRVLRGAALAGAAAGIALVGHVGGGGHAPSVPALLVVAALVGAGFVVLADRRRGFGQILAGALLSQPLFHFTFSLAEQHGPADPHAGPPSAEALATLGQHTPLAELLAAPFTGIDPAMVGGHVAAAIAIAWLMAYGETVLWSLFELLARTAAPILSPIPAWGAPLAIHAGAPLVTLPRRQHLARVRPRRGPPALCG